MNCKKCGASIPDEALFCPICGAACAIPPTTPSEPVEDVFAATVALPKAKPAPQQNRPPQYHGSQTPPYRPAQQMPEHPAQPARRQGPMAAPQAPVYPPMQQKQPSMPQKQTAAPARPAQEILTPDQLAPEQYLPEGPLPPAAPEKHSKIGRIIVVFALIFALLIGAGGGFTAAWFLYGQQKEAAAQSDPEYYIAEKVVMTCTAALNENDQNSLRDVLVSDDFLCAYYSDRMSEERDWKKVLREHYDKEEDKAKDAILKYARDINRTAFLYFAGGSVTTALPGYAEEQTFDYGEGHQEQLPLENVSLSELPADRADALRDDIIGHYQFGERAFDVRDVRAFTVDKDGKVQITLVKLDDDKNWKVLSLVVND